MLLIFLKLFLMQLAVAAVVVFVLKKMLDHQLVEIAVKKFEACKLGAEDQKLNGIIVLATAPLKPSVQERLSQSAEKKFNRQMQLFVKKDKTLRGGIVIKLHSIVIDYSVTGRLREGRILRSEINHGN